MAIDKRQRNRTFSVVDDSNFYVNRMADGVFLAVLMDIRDDLFAIRARLDCHQTLGIPLAINRIAQHTDRIRLNTTRRKRRPTPKGTTR